MGCVALTVRRDTSAVSTALAYRLLYKEDSLVPPAMLPPPASVGDVGIGLRLLLAAQVGSGDTAAGAIDVGGVDESAVGQPGARRALAHGRTQVVWIA